IVSRGAPPTARATRTMLLVESVSRAQLILDPPTSPGQLNFRGARVLSLFDCRKRVAVATLRSQGLDTRSCTTYRGCAPWNTFLRTFTLTEKGRNPEATRDSSKTSPFGICQARATFVEQRIGKPTFVGPLAARHASARIENAGPA